MVIPWAYRKLSLAFSIHGQTGKNYLFKQTAGTPEPWVRFPATFSLKFYQFWNLRLGLKNFDGVVATRLNSICSVLRMPTKISTSRADFFIFCRAPTLEMRRNSVSSRVKKMLCHRSDESKTKFWGSPIDQTMTWQVLQLIVVEAFEWSCQYKAYVRNKPSRYYYLMALLMLL